MKVGKRKINTHIKSESGKEKNEEKIYKIFLLQQEYAYESESGKREKFIGFFFRLQHEHTHVWKWKWERENQCTIGWGVLQGSEMNKKWTMWK